MKSAAIFFLFLVGTLSYSQNSVEDSLKSAYLNGDDESLSELINFYKRDNLDSLSKYVAISLLMTNEPNAIYLELVEGYLNFNEYKKAQLLLDSIQVKEVDKSAYAQVLIYRGKILYKNKNNTTALETFYKALDLVKGEKLTFLEPEIYFEIAGILRENNDLAGCTKYYRFASDKAKNNGNVDLNVRANIQLCKVYNGWVTVNLDSSVYYGELAIKTSKEVQYELGYASALSIAAAPIIRHGEVRRGLEMSKEALGYADKFNFPLKDRYYLVLNQGFAFESLGEFDSAMFYMEKASKLRPQSIDHYRLRYIILKSQGFYKRALLAHELYSSKVDSTLRSRNQSNLSLAQARYETDLKEKEVISLSQKAAIQEFEIQQKSQTIIIGLVAGLFVIAVIYFFFKQREIKKQQTQTELEHRFLRSQLNPHFISNALVAVQSFMLKNDSESAALYLTKFSKLMREILENSRKEFIPVEEEVGMIENYLEIHQLRLGTFDFSIEVDEKIDPNIDTIPPMFVQPFIENAIEHGIANLQDGKIELRFKKDGDYISIEINDNGKGLVSTKTSDHNSLSSKIIRERMAIFNRSLKNKIQLVIQNLNGINGEITGTSVQLRVPFG